MGCAGEEDVGQGRALARAFNRGLAHTPAPRCGTGCLRPWTREGRRSETAALSLHPALVSILPFASPLSFPLVSPPLHLCQLQVHEHDVEEVVRQLVAAIQRPHVLQLQRQAALLTVVLDDCPVGQGHLGIAAAQAQGAGVREVEPCSGCNQADSGSHGRRTPAAALLPRARRPETGIFSASRCGPSAWQRRRWTSARCRESRPQA